MITTSIAKRYCGPPQSGNGGYSCGLLGKQIEGPSKVRLHVPPPLDSDLTIEKNAGSWLLKQGEQLIGTAMAAQLDIVPPQPPSLEQARAARKNYRGFGEHSFPHCFVCGTGREQGDGRALGARQDQRERTRPEACREFLRGVVPAHEAARGGRIEDVADQRVELGAALGLEVAGHKIATHTAVGVVEQLSVDPLKIDRQANRFAYACILEFL